MTSTPASGDLDAALLYNRKLWTVFVAAVTDSAHQMPVQLRENIANVGVFVFLRTAELQQQPEANAMTALIDINRNIAAGLRGYGLSVRHARPGCILKSGRGLPDPS
jgi:flagellar biosynthesis regulator FlaF